MKSYIYALKCPKTDKIRYIGQTVRKPSYRYKDHLAEAKRYNRKKTKKSNWIVGLLRNNQLPLMVILEELDFISIETLDEREKYWIKYYKDLYYNLLNLTEGGRASYPREKKTIDRPLFSYNEKTKEVISYKDTKEASKIIKRHHSNIPKAIFIKGRCAGLFWSYENNFDTFNIRPAKYFTRIAAFNDSFYKEYDSILQCMEDLGIPKTCKSIMGYRLNDGLIYKGYYFKRLEGKNNCGKKVPGGALN